MLGKVVSMDATDGISGVIKAGAGIPEFFTSKTFSHIDSRPLACRH